MKDIKCKYLALILAVVFVLVACQALAFAQTSTEGLLTAAESSLSAADINAARNAVNNMANSDVKLKYMQRLGIVDTKVKINQNVDSVGSPEISLAVREYAGELPESAYKTDILNRLDDANISYNNIKDEIEQASSVDAINIVEGKIINLYDANQRATLLKLAENRFMDVRTDYEGVKETYNTNTSSQVNGVSVETLTDPDCEGNKYIRNKGNGTIKTAQIDNTSSVDNYTYSFDVNFGKNKVSHAVNVSLKYPVIIGDNVAYDFTENTILRITPVEIQMLAEDGTVATNLTKTFSDITTDCWYSVSLALYPRTKTFDICLTDKVTGEVIYENLGRGLPAYNNPQKQYPAVIDRYGIEAVNLSFEGYTNDETESIFLDNVMLQKSTADTVYYNIARKTLAYAETTLSREDYNKAKNIIKKISDNNLRLSLNLMAEAAYVNINLQDEIYKCVDSKDAVKMNTFINEYGFGEPGSETDLYYGLRRDSDRVYFLENGKYDVTQNGSNIDVTAKIYNYSDEIYGADLVSAYFDGDMMAAYDIKPIVTDGLGQSIFASIPNAVLSNGTVKNFISYDGKAGGEYSSYDKSNEITNVEAEVFPETGKIILRGSSTIESGKNANILVSNANDDHYLTIGTAEADDKGNFVYEFTANKPADGEDYIITASGSGISRYATYYGMFRFFTKADSDTAVAAINAAPNATPIPSPAATPDPSASEAPSAAIAAMENALFTYKNIINIKIGPNTDYEDIENKNVLFGKMLEGCPYASAVDVQKKYNELKIQVLADEKRAREEAVALAALNSSLPRNINSTIKAYNTWLQFDLTSTYGYPFMDNPNAFNALIAGLDFTSVVQARNIFQILSAYYVLNEFAADASGAITYKDTYISTVIEANNNVFKLELTDDYNELNINQKQKCFEGIKTVDFKAEISTFLVEAENNPVFFLANFDTLCEDINNEVKSLFASAFAEVLASNNPSGGNESPDGGGGGGGNGGNGGSSLSIPVVPTITKFNDIANVTWAIKAINALYDRGIVNGVGDKIFDPNGAITREAYIKMIVVAFNQLDENASVDFSDLPKEHWSYPYVASAVDRGITNGIGDGVFGLGSEMTRQDMAVMTERIAKLMYIDLGTGSLSKAFDDEDQIADYAKDAVKIMRASGIMNGVGENEFAPTATVTRAMSAKVIYEVLCKAGKIN